MEQGIWRGNIEAKIRDLGTYQWYRGRYSEIFRANTSQAWDSNCNKIKNALVKEMNCMPEILVLTTL